MPSEPTPEQTLDTLRRKLFVGTSVACAASGKSRSQVARMAANGSLPAVRSGRRWLFPTAPLLRMLGREDLIPEPTADDLNLAEVTGEPVSTDSEPGRGADGDL